MSEFKFDGNWETKIRLAEFSKFSNPEFFHSFQSNNNLDGIFKMHIEDFKNLNPDPEEKQINTINFLSDEKNQINIIESTFKYIRDVAYQEMQSYAPKKEFPDRYPDLKSVIDLYYVIRVLNVTIHNISKDEFACYTISFYSSFNYESQLNLTFDKLRVLDQIEWSNFPSEKVASELGGRDLTEEEYEQIIEKEKKEQEELIIYKPHPKYGKLKPWQIRENAKYSGKLLMKEKYKELKSYIESKGDIENQKSGLLYTIVSGKKNVPDFFLEYLLENRPIQIEEIAPYALSLEDKSIFLRLVDFGYNINEVRNDSTLLRNRIASLKHNIQVKYFDRAEQTKKEIEYLMNRGANPNIRGKYKGDTFSYIKQISEEQIRIEVESFFNKLCSKYGVEKK